MKSRYVRIRIIAFQKTILSNKRIFANQAHHDIINYFRYIYRYFLFFRTFFDFPDGTVY